MDKDKGPDEGKESDKLDKPNKPDKPDKSDKDEVVDKDPQKLQPQPQPNPPPGSGGSNQPPHKPNEGGGDENT